MHGYLPFGIGWYRKKFTPPASLSAAATMYIDFDGIQTKSQVWLNGEFLGSWDYGYTGSRYFLDKSVLKLGESNVLAVRVDCTEPDGWWYDGGGIYRNVRFTAVMSPGPHIAPWGLYVGGSKPTGEISWDADGNPSADSELMPQVEVWNNGTASSDFSLALTVKDKSGATVVSTSGKGTLAGGAGVNWSPEKALAMPAAKLWHVWTNSTNVPALYTATAELTVGGKVVDSVTETFGVRKTEWSNATGFSLNDKPFKILGNANHQDFAAVGVAVPDHLQWYRVQGQKNCKPRRRLVFSLPSCRLSEIAVRRGQQRLAHSAQPADACTTRRDGRARLRLVGREPPERPAGPGAVADQARPQPSLGRDLVHLQRVSAATVVLGLLPRL